MVPYYEAVVQFRVMTDRAERVRIAHTYFLEYLKLMNHYNLLEKTQVKAFKDMYKKHTDKLKGVISEDEPQGGRPGGDPMAMLASQMQDRDAKVAAYRLKKEIEHNLDLLKDYKDEQAQREFYKTQIQFSVLNTFESLRMTEMEMQIHAHRATLTPEQIAANERASAPKKRGDMPPLQTMFIGPDDVKDLPYMMMPDRRPAQEAPVVNTYADPLAAMKKIERITVEQTDINDRMNLRQ